MGTLLDSIHSPADLKRMSMAQMTELAEEIREFLIQTLSKTGGHLGPNLGVVELTLALHTVFNTPEDKLLFDVSHQAYIHKIITGRLERFGTIRQQGGLNGFMLRTESEHDCYGAGHAGTALSAALGMAVARDLSGGKEHVIAVAGDAAFTNGISFEALNNIAAQTKRMIVVLNDNEWSIDRNVGAIASYFHRIVTNEHYQHLHDSAHRIIERFGGKTAAEVARRAEEAAKGLLWPSMMFEEFGLQYFGPIDGHNLPLLVETFRFLKGADRPVLLHVLTQKGRGFQPALEKKKKFHGLGPYDPETGMTEPAGLPSYSEVFATTLAGLADKDDRIVAVTAAMPSGTGLDLFRPRHPKRYFDVGIAEEHAVVFAAGMATQGLPACLRHLLDFFAAGFRSHGARRLPAKAAGALLHGPRRTLRRRWTDASWPVRYQLSARHSGDSVDGAQGRGRTGRHDEDRVGDSRTQRHSLSSWSCYWSERKAEPQAIPVGKAEVIKDGSDVAILGLGPMVTMARELAERLEYIGYSAAVINPRFVKPLDLEVLEQYSRRVAAFVTFEDHVKMGGFGSAVIEALEEMGSTVPVVRIGWPDKFIEHGKVAELRARHGLTVDEAQAQVLPLLCAARAQDSGCQLGTNSNQISANHREIDAA